MKHGLVMDNIRKWVPFLVLLVLVLFFAAVNPHFLSLRNFARIAVSSSPALMVAVGATFVILMGSIDLSMEGTVAVCAVVFAMLLNRLGGSLAHMGWLAIPGAMIAGGVLGAVNGLIHVRLRIPSFMASLSMGFVGVGLSLLMTGGNRILIGDPLFRSLLTVRIMSFPLMAYAALGGLLVAWFIQGRTTIGRNFYAIGGGEDLARASGLNVGRVRVIGFVLAGVFFALGAVLAVARLGIAETETGTGFMFLSITSVVVGGTALAGGSGGVWNTLVGVLIVNVIGNGMVVVGLPDYLQDGVLGLLVITAVYLSMDRRGLSFAR
ncbi:ABC transporter permease [Gluconacetobacter liquefaciens]|uniref:ABC transporter permease n=1 Tax=Gluconacetobacter liquefaciens TaxID=89584 RepID=A0A370GDD0_GLULI|nr:ABC transporter permease [Gluconacetobacter liquefaciens]MBB2185036.1 ABC transporter permease [Gluconacetobacter liquefaciens]RDI40464.1 monosaccharide ABC transporter membrane protein (CUT2 family) [Gluconacetobacter liquefaciens]GBR03849.1 ribose/xylose/arabinose/galactoside ABC transporter permease [Gluconacetobacter liquefaciens NRIC 0522]GEB37396.1 ABC transporter permease [Gluconacetobacter liquefaciens]